MADLHCYLVGLRQRVRYFFLSFQLNLSQKQISQGFHINFYMILYLSLGVRVEHRYFRVAIEKVYMNIFNRFRWLALYLWNIFSRSWRLNRFFLLFVLLSLFEQLLFLSLKDLSYLSVPLSFTDSIPLFSVVSFPTHYKLSLYLPFSLSFSLSFAEFSHFSLVNHFPLYDLLKSYIVMNIT